MSSDTQKHSKHHSLKLFSLNCWLVPCYSRENTKRIYAIIELIKKQDPDIVLLQEVWIKPYVELFKKHLSAYSFHHSSGWLNKTGLLTGSKTPLPCETHLFPLTSKHLLIEKIGKKGFHALHLPAMTIINTHLYTPKNGEHSDDVLKQRTGLDIAEQQLRMICNMFPKGNLIVAGDFNIGQSRFMNVNTFFTYNSHNIPTIDMHYRTKIVPKYIEIIDYVLKSKSSSLKLKTTVLTQPSISDHRPIIATVSVS